VKYFKCYETEAFETTDNYQRTNYNWSFILVIKQSSVSFYSVWSTLVSVTFYSKIHSQVLFKKAIESCAWLKLRSRPQVETLDVTVSWCFVLITRVPRHSIRFIAIAFGVGHIFKEIFICKRCYTCTETVFLLRRPYLLTYLLHRA